jgi:hypothetical protein
VSSDGRQPSELGHGQVLSSWAAVEFTRSARPGATALRERLSELGAATGCACARGDRACSNLDDIDQIVEAGEVGRMTGEQGQGVGQCDSGDEQVSADPRRGRLISPDRPALLTRAPVRRR